MTRRLLAFIATIFVAAGTSPALANDDPPAPAWVDPQAPGDPEDFGGAEALHGPWRPGPWAPGVPYPGGPMAWHGAAGADGYAYAIASGGAAAPCGCASPGYAMVWVPVRIETRYRYTPAIRHEREVVEHETVPAEIVETKSVPVRQSKYVKVAPAKPARSKIVRSTK